VMEAFLDGMEQAKANGHDLTCMGSVASFFVSRVDTEIDKRLDKSGGAKELRGKAGIANAQLAYEHYEKVFASDRWKALERAGARPQRPLWASTGVKDPAYDDTQYVVQLVAPGTVNTMPEPTLDAVADHGVIRGDSVTSSYGDAQKLLDDLRAAGIDYDDVVQQLEVEGVQKFEDAWNELIESVTANLEKAGADIGPGGGSSPAGSGPAAASPEGSA
jgi:transaldolase